MWQKRPREFIRKFYTLPSKNVKSKHRKFGYIYSKKSGLISNISDFQYRISETLWNASQKSGSKYFYLPEIMPNDL